MLPNLYKNRHGTYYLRITIGKREIKRSLRTKEPTRAKLAATAFAWIRAMDLKKPFPYELPMGLDPEKLRELGVILPNGTRFTDIETDDDARRVALIMKAADAGASPDAILDLLRTPVPGGMPLERRVELVMGTLASPAVGKTEKFSAAVKMYLAEKELAGNRGKTISDKKSSYDAFQEMHGDLDMNAYDDAMALGWKNRLIASGIGPIRINTKLSQFNDFFDWAQRNRLRLLNNPFKEMRVGKKDDLVQQTESYEPFDQEELDRIFDPAGYTAFMHAPDYKWLPLLALYTGARLGELASLEVKHIKRTGGIWWFDITEGKNTNSIRKVPLHPVIEGSGFLDYVEEVRLANIADAKGKKLLFPHLVKGKNGYSKNTTRRFGEWLDKLGITDPRKVFHSFRSTFISRMSEHNVHPAMLMALVGHYDQAKVDLDSPHFKDYQGRAKLLPHLKETMDLFSVRIAMQFTHTPGIPKRPRPPRAKSDTAQPKRARPKSRARRAPPKAPASA